MAKVELISLGTQDVRVTDVKGDYLFGVRLDDMQTVFFGRQFHSALPPFEVGEVLKVELVQDEDQPYPRAHRIVERSVDIPNVDSIHKLRQEIAALKAANGALHDENVSLIDEISDLQDSLAALQENLTGLKTEKSAVVGRVSDAGAVITNLKLENSKLNAKVSKLEEELAAAKLKGRKKKIRGTPRSHETMIYGYTENGDRYLDVEACAAAVGKTLDEIMALGASWSKCTVEYSVRQSVLNSEKKKGRGAVSLKEYWARRQAA